jgi:SAM-dependent methyltransferase
MQVIKDDVLNLEFGGNSVEVVLFSDVFEHLHFREQPTALSDIRRVLIPGGVLLCTIPNLAHFDRGATMAIYGRLDRTDIETNHVGERPLKENLSCCGPPVSKSDRSPEPLYGAPVIAAHHLRPGFGGCMTQWSR